MRKTKISVYTADASANIKLIYLLIYWSRDSFTPLSLSSIIWPRQMELVT